MLYNFTKDRPAFRRVPSLAFNTKYTPLVGLGLSEKNASPEPLCLFNSSMDRHDSMPHLILDTKYTPSVGLAQKFRYSF